MKPSHHQADQGDIASETWDIPITDIPVSAIPARLAEIAVQRGRLAAIENALLARLVLHSAPRPDTSDSEDELVDARAASRLLGMSTHWIYRNASRLPFARRIGDRTLRFSVRGIRKYQATRQRP